MLLDAAGRVNGATDQSSASANMKGACEAMGLSAKIRIGRWPGVKHGCILLAAMAAAVWLSFGVIVFALVQRRCALAARLSAKAQACSTARQSAARKAAPAI